MSRPPKSSNKVANTASQWALHAIPQTNEMNINASRLPPPTRTFPSVCSRVDQVGDSFMVSFGQYLQPGRLLSACVIQMNSVALNSLLKTFDPDFMRTINTISVPNPDGVCINEEVLYGLPADRIAILSANVARITVSDLGASIEWYEFQPHLIHLVFKQVVFGANPVPVISVMLSASAVKVLVNQLVAFKLRVGRVEDHGANDSALGVNK